MADEWQYTSERVVPHSLCCERCKAASVRVVALETTLTRIVDLAYDALYAQVSAGMTPVLRRIAGEAEDALERAERGEAA